MKLSKSDEVIMVPEDSVTETNRSDIHEEGVEVPYEQLNPDTLRNLISEFVTREWEELGDSWRYSLDDKIEQVLQQLRQKKARVMFDLKTSSCNIVVNK